MHDAAFDAAGIDARYVLLELEPDAVAGRRRARRAAPTGSASASPRRTSAWSPGCATRSSQRPTGSARSTTCVRRDDGSLLGFNSDAPGFRAGVELAMGRLARRRRGRGRRGRRCGACRGLRLPRAGAREVIVGNRTAVPRRPSCDASPASDAVPGQRSPWTIRPSPPRSGRRTWRSTRRPSACSIRGRPSRSSCCRRTPRSSTCVYVPPETPLLARGSRARPAGGERVGDAHRPGRDRVRALDRRGRHGRRHARGRRAAARRRDRPGLTVRSPLVEAAVLGRVVVDDRCLPVATATRARSVGPRHRGERPDGLGVSGPGPIASRQPPADRWRTWSSDPPSRIPARSTRSG